MNSRISLLGPRARRIGVVLLAAIAFSASASANKKECADAYVAAQKHKKAGALLDAREQLIVCAREQCMVAVKKECLQWLDEVNLAIPSLVVVAKDAAGKETLDVVVKLGDRVLADRIDTRGIELDPGTHELTFELEGEEPISVEVILRAGERNKVVEVSFAKAASSVTTDPTDTEEEASLDLPPRAPSSGPPTISYVLGGVGVLALTGTAVFWLGADSKQSELESCKPRCSQDDVDSVKQRRLFGDIALGIGVASLGAAAYFWLAPGKEKPPAEAAALSVDLAPGGAFARYRTTF
ncbi:MAG: hypothetical protein KF718_33410 [Polyangiaceae bacterium]|nr:hypothetical protein [Polyangiaceae bacterium]